MKFFSDNLLAPININRHLQDVFGEQQQLLQLLLICLFGYLNSRAIAVFIYRIF